MDETKRMHVEKLSTTTVFLGKNKKGTHTRSGFADKNGQVFLPPANANGLTVWQNKMKDLGYEFS